MPLIQEDDQAGPYRVADKWHSQHGTIRVIHVGAGAAGLLMAYKMKKLFDDYELVCYDKNPSVAGTWYENRYPGCACDVPAHAYTFTFEPNPNWSSFYAYAPEIRKYFEDFATKHDLHPFIQLNSRVLSATWDESSGTYAVEVEVNGEKKTDWCHVLVNGTGFLNNWKWPNVPGLHDFKGKLMHTANWDDSVDWAGKKVAVIGTGSSAIQCVPRIQKTAAHLTSFMRSVTWICAPVGGSVLEEEKKKKEEDGGVEDSVKKQEQYFYTEEDKERFREEPGYLLNYRRKLEGFVNSLFDLFYRGSETSKQAQTMMQQEMERRIGPGHEELKSKVIPSWPPGCRRLTPGDGYLEALVQPNVTTCHDEIEKVVAEGVVDATGKLHEVDILVCATGFNLAFTPPFEVSGVGRVKMSDEFDPEPQVYLSMAVPKFPSYFIVNGVRGNWAAGTALPSHEVCVEYILKCVKKIQEEGIRALEVKQEPVTQLYEHIDAWHQGSVWNADCKSWYKNNIPGGKLWIWGGSALHFMKTLRDVKWEHFDHRYRSSNMWAYLGNGKTKAQVLQQVDKLAPYMRNEDSPWEIE